MPMAALIATGVVMPRWSSSRKISLRRRIVVSRSAYRARRSSGASFGFSGGDGGGGWSETGSCQHGGHGKGRHHPPPAALAVQRVIPTRIFADLFLPL